METLLSFFFKYLLAPLFVTVMLFFLNSMKNLKRKLSTYFSFDNCPSLPAGTSQKRIRMGRTVPDNPMLHRTRIHFLEIHRIRLFQCNRAWRIHGRNNTAAVCVRHTWRMDILPCI